MHGTFNYSKGVSVKQLWLPSNLHKYRGMGLWSNLAIHRS